MRKNGKPNVSKDDLKVIMKRINYLAKFVKRHDAAVLAWYFHDVFEPLLRSKVVQFSFWKDNPEKESGYEIREALGTKILFFVPFDKWPNNTAVDHINTTSYKVITFFDLRKQEWRSFNIRNFIGFVDIWPED